MVLEDYGYEVYHPMTAKGILRNDIEDREFPTTGFDHPAATNNAIFQRDRWMVHQSDVCYVNLIGAEAPSQGCISEIAIAYENNKHIVLAMEPDNVHRHAFILCMASIIFPTHEDAERYLRQLITGDM